MDISNADELTKKFDESSKKIKGIIDGYMNGFNVRMFSVYIFGYKKN